MKDPRKTAKGAFVDDEEWEKYLSYLEHRAEVWSTVALIISIGTLGLTVLRMLVL